MAYTHHNDAMTSAPNNVYVNVSSALVMAVVMMCVNHSLVSRLFGALLGHS